MDDQKARFHFATEGQNSKTTVVKVKTIQLINQLEVFEFPVDQQTAAYHKKLFQHPVVKGVVNSLKERNKFRNVVITLTKEGLRDEYMDEEGNVVFNEYYLEAVTDIHSPQPLQGPPSVQDPVQEKPIHSVVKNMVLEKFNGNNFNAESWLNMFKSECNRLNIGEGRFAEVLRLFLENSALNWHAIFLKTHSLTHEWELWNNSFIETFCQKSWSEIEYAYMYKYLNGTFFEFALKKRNLLIDIDPELTINSQINLIVIALPNYVKSKLSDKIETIENLMTKLKTIEPITNKLKNSEIEINVKQKQNNSNERKGKNYSPCTYCENIGYPNRYHPENLCRTKLNKTIQKNEKIKIVNNTELQNLISSTEEAKN